MTQRAPYTLIVSACVCVAATADVIFNAILTILNTKFNYIGMYIASVDSRFVCAQQDDDLLCTQCVRARSLALDDMDGREKTSKSLWTKVGIAWQTWPLLWNFVFSSNSHTNTSSSPLTRAIEKKRHFFLHSRKFRAFCPVRSFVWHSAACLRTHTKINVQQWDTLLTKPYTCENSVSIATSVICLASEDNSRMSMHRFTSKRTLVTA